MSEQDRSRLYAWLREHADEPIAEYMMSCLPPAPLPDLVTKDFLTSELSRFATKDDLAKLDAKVVRLDAKVVQVDTKVDLLATQHKSDRDEDRRTNRVRHYWLAGIGVSTVVSVWLSAAGVIA
ncbi:hypothetical protein [Candidatus Poriferisodalis sp.]|uniref:hypothetical protein n=1 Tax=Candidatus Poriferisodalis sp. TaxID=3101277 RepID=UPI003B01A245